MIMFELFSKYKSKSLEIINLSLKINVMYLK